MESQCRKSHSYLAFVKLRVLILQLSKWTFFLNCVSCKLTFSLNVDLLKSAGPLKLALLKSASYINCEPPKSANPWKLLAAEIGKSAKRCVIEGGINSEIGLSEGCACKEIAFDELDQIIKPGPCEECRTHELSLLKAGIFVKLRRNEIYRVVEDRP